MVKFPEGFRFGVANADHQVEAYRKTGEDVWDLWERCQNLTPRGRAADFWEHYEADIERAASLGVRLFRFSVSWARVELDEGVWDGEALAHYRKVAQKVRDERMEVMLTLVHFTWPVWLERQGGLVSKRMPELFARYANKLGEVLGDLVDYWITFNEPTQLVFGFIKPWWQSRYYMPPGLPEGAGAAEQAEAVGKLIPNLFLAHAQARSRLKERLEGAKVGVNPLVTGFPPWLQWLMDAQAGWGWFTQAMYRFSMAAPLVSEHAKVDFALGGLKLQEDAFLGYSEPYTYTGKAVLVREGDGVDSLEALAGRRVGLVREGNTEQLAEGHLPKEVEKVHFEGYGDALLALESGSIDALYGDEFLMVSPAWGGGGVLSSSGEGADARIIRSGLASRA